MEKKAKRKVGHFYLRGACIPAAAQGRLSPPGDVAAVALLHGQQPSPNLVLGEQNSGGQMLLLH